MQTKYIGGKNAIETCRMLQIEHAGKKHVRVHRICREKRRKTRSQDKQTKRADRTSGQIMQIELLRHLFGTVTSASFL